MKNAVIDQSHIETRMVQNPLISDAEFSYRKSLKPDAPNIGMIEVNVNLKEKIGGFWRYRDRTEPQTMAAARFKGLHEASQIGGARAIDYERPCVDTSTGPITLVMERGEAARRQYRDAVRAIGMRWSNLIEQVVVYDRSQTRIARAYKFGDGGAGKELVRTEVYRAMDALAAHFHY